MFVNMFSPWSSVLSGNFDWFASRESNSLCQWMIEPSQVGPQIFPGNCEDALSRQSRFSDLTGSLNGGASEWPRVGERKMNSEIPCRTLVLAIVERRTGDPFLRYCLWYFCPFPRVEALRIGPLRMAKTMPYYLRKASAPSGQCRGHIA